MNDWQFLEPHPLAEIFPMLEEAQLSELADDMARNGFDARYPIVLYGGKVLDGRNRLAAAVAARLYPGANVHPAFVDYAGADPLAFVIRANLRRRHLGVGQRAMIAADLLPQWEEAARREQAAAGGDRKSEKAKSLVASLPQAISETPKPVPPKSRDKAASLLGVSGRSVTKA